VSGFRCQVSGVRWERSEDGGQMTEDFEFGSVNAEVGKKDQEWTINAGDRGS